MKHHKNVEWKRLDNAAKIFPPTSNEKDTKVFRFALELYEEVDPIILQEALDKTMENFPFFSVILRRGIFWYYFEKTNERPLIEQERNTVCAPIFNKDDKNLLFRVFYYHKRISLEMHHSLSDGTGALWFLKTLIYYYLIKKHKDSFGASNPKKPYYASITEKVDDSFLKYYSGKKITRYSRSTRAHRISGSRKEDNRMILIEGSMSVKETIKEAHKYNTTLTGFLASIFLFSIYKEMSVRERKRPVVLSIPVNLRQFFESESARNFFATIRVNHLFDHEVNDIEKVVESVNQGLKDQLTAEKLNEQMNQFVSFERTSFIKVIPLPLKDFVLRMVDRYNEKGITAALSNIGRIDLPEEFSPYINQFTVCTSARRPQLSVCSYKDNLTLSFTSPFLDTEIQRNFFEFLSEKGIDINIASNIDE